MEIKISAQHFLDVTKGMNKKKPFGYVGQQDFIIPFLEVKPIDGYEIPINKKTGKKLPFCCSFHSKLFYGITKWYDKEFPNCCSNHKILAASQHFKKTDYKTVASKVVNQLSYTEHVIRTSIDNSDWYKDITDYIEYNTFSFGHPVSVGNNYYLNNLLAMLEDAKFFEGMEERKKVSLIDFVKSNFEPVKKVQTTDLNLLYSTYQNWLNTFPFDLSFFKNLKPYFENQFPILKGQAETNKYLGTTKFKIHTEESLIIHLLSVTDSIIKQINTYILYKKGLLKEPEKVKLEIILSEREFELKNGYLSDSGNSKQFENVLAKWFTHEKRFIEEIVPLLKHIPNQDTLKEDINELQKLTQDIATKGKLILEKYENGFNQSIKSFKFFFEKNGIIVPSDSEDFFHWIALIYPDENVPFIIEAAKNPNNFKLYHEYKERLFNNPGWNDKKEEEFFSNYKNSCNEEYFAREKYHAKHYVLAYIFDCYAIDKKLPRGNKKELERIGNKRIGKGRGNTFYKNFNLIVNKNLHNKEILIGEVGESWREIILNLSENPERLENYLQSKKMY
ncbi:hypothetical protein [Elizabethkingia anophelis]|uniref:hypothetical protein n=1 Tax=Elizabethkingia anophelis TaxID=1117645 RepID=UPI00293CBE69|nr:hypothetical protein [Elizabethkingia anophelis]